MTTPKERRGNGLGSRLAGEINRLAQRGGFRYLYLIAKKDAERFWRRQEFAYVQRRNLRNKRRQERALRRVPGWDTAWLDGTRLPEPNWYYRNHPQDDMDLYRVFRLLDIVQG